MWQQIPNTPMTYKKGTNQTSLKRLLFKTQIFPPDKIILKANGVKPVSESNGKTVCSTCKSILQETIYLLVTLNKKTVQRRQDKPLSKKKLCFLSNCT